MMGDFTTSTTPPQFVYQAQHYQPSIPLQIEENGKLVIRVYSDGRVGFGPGMTPDEGARRMWKLIALQYGSVCPKAQVVAP